MLVGRSAAAVRENERRDGRGSNGRDVGYLRVLYACEL